MLNVYNNQINVRLTSSCSVLILLISVILSDLVIIIIIFVYFSESTGPRDGATPPQDTSPREVPPTGWAALGLTYKVQWPLHILFTPAVLEKCVLMQFHISRIYSVACWVQLLSLLSCVFRYNVVFRYLLSVRRVQSQLQHCWALQMQRKHLKSSQTDAVKWRLRNHMAFLIDNLQYYLQVMKVKEAPHVYTICMNAHFPKTEQMESTGGF